MSEPLTTERVPLGSLKPFPGNPKRHDLEALRESIREHGGQYRSVVVAADNVILAGHGTIEALAAEGHTEVDVNRRPYDHKDPRARKIVVADNRLPERGELDTADLTVLLQGLEGDLGGTGYADGDVAALLASLDPPAQHAPGLGTPIIQYQIVFETEQQQKGWYNLLRRLNQDYPDLPTVAARIAAHATAFLAE